MANYVHKYLRMVDKYQKSIKLFVAKSSCRAEIFKTLQTYKGFSRVIYSILNSSAILKRNETRLERNEMRLERNETRKGRKDRAERQKVPGLVLPWVVQAPVPALLVRPLLVWVLGQEALAKVEGHQWVPP